MSFTPGYLQLLYLFISSLIPYNSVVGQGSLLQERVSAHAQRWMEEKIERSREMSGLGDILNSPNEVITPLGRAKAFGGVNITQSENAESEVTAAVNPSDPSKMVACAIRTVGEDYTLPIFFTEDGGESWQESAFRPEECSIGPLEARIGGGDPVMVYDKDGQLHLTWLIITSGVDENLVFGIHTKFCHAVSNDNGSSWTIENPAVACATNGFNSSLAIDKEWLIADTNENSPNYGNLYMPFTKLNILSPDSVLYQILISTRTEETGWSDTSVVAVSSDDLPFCQFVHPAIDSEGNLHLIMAGATFTDEFTALYHCSSNDGGLTFSPPTRISYFNLSCFLLPAGSAPCVEGISPPRTWPSNYLYANPTNDELYVVWCADGFTAQTTEGVNVYFSHSTDGGERWSDPVIVNDTSDISVDHFMPTGVVDEQGDFYITWYDQRDSVSGTQYYGRKYDAAEGVFKSEFVISMAPTDFRLVGNNNADFGVGEYNTTLCSDGKLLPVWADGRTNDGNLEIYLATVAKDTGTTSVRVVSPNYLTLKIAPNPVTDQLIFQLENEKSLTSLVGEITDLSGRILRRASLASGLTPPGKHAYSIDVDGLPNGAYLLWLTSPEGGRIAKKFLKLR